ncbi:Histone-lysine N-methyltransferase SETMAR [Habropoda laboriosa]|uniref:Histone-lysine N-methyltransferase SETMAR n=1 Tax=Habropoda laboriosa TaxID=597456 RepID=A0A0L7QYC6_9HYME|nr:Histone-lysine N-methyltransferase SETMAR [Habropoda laboriosa]
MLDKKQLRAIFLYEFKRGRKAAETARNINEAFGQDTVNERAVQRWFARFRNGDESLEDEEHGSRPSEVHPPYSPDLSPTDYHFFKHLDHFLREKCFKNQDEAKNAFNAFVTSRTPEFYATGINKLVSRWQRCIDSNGSYFD